MFNRDFFKKELDPTKVEPIEYKVLLRFLKKPAQTEGGLYIPSERKELEDSNSIVAEVMKIGELAFTKEDYTFLEKKPKVGDIIICNKFPGLEICNNETERWFLAPDKEIIAIYKINNEVKNESNK